ncbi:16S rRNA (uracil(1498)-N(3))-methyltransferase [Yinghuangia seranimata]|uniref:16S rRNA (uracil(1498)-N(3))-methyltransferase n=1 Tax=Yinghuangia seranimata TaxID=408067 RepID=UPI00248B9138|nr:16S rRNA (uracil(1498)-N(3))-methyltransferase [Yinghuangia seranimata]MDI2127470.1 16S rRNA (uracil(1498)-N(3))-methyltransferase [Yinghuangia seranimata]
MSAPVFLTDDPSLRTGRRVVLDGPEGRHAVTVRRIAVGEEVVLTDGRGLSVRGTVAVVEGKDTLYVDVVERVDEPAPTPRVVVVQALPKGDRGELAVETMTEVGVDVIVPWAAARCITQWKGDRGAKSLAKWRATGREAGKQARRTHLPEVTELMTTRQVAALLGDAAFAGVLHESADVPLATAELPGAGDLVLVVGPEGGVAPEELAAFAEAGARAYRLGPTVLRTSTAGVSAASVLLARSGRWA